MAPLPESSTQSGAELVQRITILDKSQESYPALYRDVLQALDLSQDACESVPSSKDLLREQRRGFTPLDEWALKWLLKRLGPQSSHGDVARVSYQSWCLLLKLIARLRLKPVARLLAEFKLSAILASTVDRLGQVTQEFAELRHDSEAQERDGLVTDWCLVFPLSFAAPSRKRKRIEGSMSFPHTQQVVLRAVSRLLSSLATLFEHVRLRTSRGPRGQEALAKEQLRSSLKMHATNAARTFGSLLDSFRVVSAQPSSFWESSELGAGVKLEPFLAIWEARYPPSEQQEEYFAQRAFCKYCLLPVLKLLCCPGLLADGNKSKLESLTFTNCLEPSYQDFWREDKAPAAERDASRALLQQAVESFQTMLDLPEHTKPVSQMVNGNSNECNAALDSTQVNASGSIARGQVDFPSPHPVTVLFQLALNSSARASHNPGPWAWESQLFVDLCKSMHVDLNPPVPIPSDICLHRITNLLDVSLQHHATLDREILERISLHLCLISKEPEPRRTGWDRLRKCVELGPSIVTKVPEAVDSAEQKKMSAVLELIVRSYTKDPRTLEADLNQSAIEALSTVAAAFANAREAPRFITLWKLQLSGEYQAFLSRGDEHRSFKAYRWSHNTLRGLLGPILLSSLTHHQVIQAVAELDSMLRQDLTETDLPHLWATTVTMNCLLAALQDDKLTEKLLDPAFSLHLRCVTVALPTMRAPLLQAELWQLEALILENWPGMIHDEASRPGLDELLLVADRQLDCVHKELGRVGPQTFESTIAAWRLFTLLTTLELEGSAHERVHALESLPLFLNKVLVTLSTSTNDSVSKLPQTTADLGRDGPGVLAENEHFVLFDFLAIAIARRQCLDLLEATDLLSTLHGLSDLAAIEYSRCQEQSHAMDLRSAEDLHSGMDLWRALLAMSLAGESQKLSDALRCFHYEALVLDAWKGPAEMDVTWRQNASRIEFLIVSLKASEERGFSGHERQQLADKIWDAFLTERLDSRPKAAAVQLLLNFLSLPRKAMKMLQDPAESLYLLANSFDQLPNQDFGSFVPFMKPLAVLLGRFVYSSQLVSPSSNLSEKVQRSLERMAQIQDSRNPPVAALVMGSVFLDNVRSVPGTGGWEATSQVYLHSMLRALTAINMEGDEMHPQLPLILEAVAVLSRALTVLQPTIAVPYASNGHYAGERPLVRDQEVNAAGFLLDLESSLKLKLEQLKIQGAPSSDLVAKTLLTVQGIQRQAFKVEAPPETKVVTGELSNYCTRVGSVQHIASLVKQFHLVDAAGKANYMRQLSSSQNLHHASHSSLMLLRAILGSSLPVDDRSEDLRTSLGQTLNSLLLATSASNEQESPHMAFRAADALVRNHAWAVTQWHVDNALSTIGVKTSPSAPSSAIEEPQRTFTSLCQLFQSILSARRSHINGRYHLVVGALNGLLRCLFHPYTPDDGSAGLEQASWLYGRASASSNPLQQEHAKAFARLLTTICDPAPGAVKPPRGNRDIPRHERHLLTDGVKKARAIAGQHLQYVITEFCALQLRGRLTPAVRAALNPGLYATFGAMSVEIQRTANATLDERGRAIFKAVYDDYMKFGRWEKG